MQEPISHYPTIRRSPGRGCCHFQQQIKGEHDSDKFIFLFDWIRTQL